LLLLLQLLLGGRVPAVFAGFGWHFVPTHLCNSHQVYI